MMYYRLSLILSGVMLVALLGCSAGNDGPVMTSVYPNGLTQLIPDADENPEGQKLLGNWVLNFNPESQDISVLPDRAGQTCYDVTNQIPQPVVTVRSYNPASRIIDLDVSITNPSTVNAYDVRLIIYNQPGKFRLLNPDNWTTNWFRSEGSLINPFRSFAKNEVNREFAASSTHTENFKFFMPQGASDVNFKIDACFPSNTKTPYLISDFDYGTLSAIETSSTYLKVNVFDWQDNVSEVILYCPAITGEIPVSLNKSGTVSWELNLQNTMGADPGNYPVYILAKSVDSGQTVQILEGEITVIAVGVPTNPQKIAKYEELYKPHDCAVQGNYLYMADDRAGLKILDISDPSNPICIGSQLIKNDTFDPRPTEVIEVSGNYAYISGPRPHFTMVDISDPHSSFVAGKASYSDISDILVVENYALISSSYNDNIKVLNVSNPSAITTVSQNSECGYVYSMRAYGNFIYAATDTGLSILTLSESGDLRLIGSYQGGQDCFDVAISYPYAYLSDQSGRIIVIDVSNPLNPQLINSLMVGLPKKITLKDNYLYLSSGQKDMYIVKITNQTQLSLVDTLEFGDVDATAALDGHLYVANGDYGMLSVDISDPTAVQVDGKLGSIVLSDIMTDTHSAYALSNGANFNTSAFSGLLILDIKDPSNPVRISAYETTNPPLAIDIQGTRAYITLDSPVHGSRNPGLFIIDISNPSNPFLISSLITFVGMDISVSGDYAYVACPSDGLRIIDISDPVHPVMAGRLAIDARSVEVSGFQAFVGLTGGGLDVVDIGIPDDPVILGYTSCGKLNNLFVSGNYVYGNVSDIGIEVIDVSNPSRPEVISTHNIEGSNEVVVHANYAYVAYDVTYDVSCMEILDVSNPTNPTDVTIVNTYLPSRGIDVRNNYAYLSEMYGGVTVIKLW